MMAAVQHSSQVYPLFILVAIAVGANARLGAPDCQENTYLCDSGNHELCNANEGVCQCEEGYFAVDGVCSFLGATNNLCREGTIGSDGQCRCYYGYTRLVDNTCGLCRSDEQCEVERGVTAGLIKCLTDGYDAKCYKPCRWDSQCHLPGQMCLEFQDLYVCRCPDELFKQPDGSCGSTPSEIGAGNTISVSVTVLLFCAVFMMFNYF